MAASEKIQGIRQFVSNFPLQEILEVAVVISEFVPGIKPIIKIIEISIKLMPAANKALDASGKIAVNIEQLQANNQTVITPLREKFNSLLDIALADGVIKDSEKNFLHTKAQEAGISDDEFEMIILSKQ